MPHHLSSTSLVFGGEFITSNRINKVIVGFFLTNDLWFINHSKHISYKNKLFLRSKIVSYRYLWSILLNP